MSGRYFERGVARQYREHTPMLAFDADHRMHDAMIAGSRALREAILTGYGPERFLWAVSDGGKNWRPTEATSKFFYRNDLIREREARADALRVSRDPCPVCATRTDIGCKHRRIA